jgi:hypothetical protein
MRAVFVAGRADGTGGTSDADPGENAGTNSALSATRDPEYQHEACGRMHRFEHPCTTSIDRCVSILLQLDSTSGRARGQIPGRVIRRFGGS